MFYFPFQSEETSLPDNLKVLFRPVAMADPDFSQISELMLKSYGFKEVRILSKKLAAMVDLCDGLLSSQVKILYRECCPDFVLTNLYV